MFPRAELAPMIDYSATFFVLRTPLLPFEEFLGLSQGLLAPQVLRTNGDLAEAYAADRKLVRSRLQELVARPEIKEALWIASPDFFESLSTWHNKPESDKGQKLEQSLYRYVARMISRATPFGLFAACATGEIGNETKLELGARATYWRRSRLDMEYLYNLAEKVSADPALRKQLRFRPNTSLYLAGGRYHHAQSYFQNSQNNDKMRLYRLVATEPTAYLDATLQRASSAATPNALAQALVDDEPDIPLEEAEQYVGQLIESQLTSLGYEVVICDRPEFAAERAAVLILALLRPQRDEVSWRFHETAAREYAHRYTALSLDPEVFEHRNAYGTLLQERSVAEKARFHYYLAKTYAHAGNIERAIQYIRMALEEGFKERQKLMEEPEFEKLRETAEFKELMATAPRVL